MKPRKEDDSQTDGIKRVSTTDPDSGFLMRDGKPKGFFYLDHRTVDAKHNIITDTFVTAGNVSDSEPYLDRLQVQIEKFHFKWKQSHLIPAISQGISANIFRKKGSLW